MKYILIGVLVLILAAGGLFFYEKKLANKNIVQIPTSILSNSENIDCTSNDLQGELSSQGAAGSIYVDVTMTNKSQKPCKIALGNSIEATYDMNIKNLSVNYKAPDNSDSLTLNPGDKVYSQLHFPNGPQCQSGINSQNVSFVYKDFKFMTNDGKDFVSVQACKADSEQTAIDIWPLSKTPVTGVQ